MIKGFRDFILRGNVIDLAVAVVIGAAFGAVIKSFVDDILMQIIAADRRAAGLLHPARSPSARASSSTARSSTRVISFLLIAAAIYFVVVMPLNKLAERRARGADPTTKTCPECLSEIPHGAHKCAFCASEQPAEA